MLPITQSELVGLQATYTDSLPDSGYFFRWTVVGTTSFGEPILDYVQGAARTPCGVNVGNSRELMQMAQVGVYSITFRFAIGVVVDTKDRYLLTHRYGAALPVPEYYEFTGPPRRGPTGVQMAGQTVTNPNDPNGM